MYRTRTVRDLQREHRAELLRRDQMIERLLDRIQHPETPQVSWQIPEYDSRPTGDDQLVADPEQLYE